MSRKENKDDIIKRGNYFLLHRNIIQCFTFVFTFKIKFARYYQHFIIRFDK